MKVTLFFRFDNVLMLLQLSEYLELCVYEGARDEDEMRRDQVSRDLLCHVYLQFNFLWNLKKLTCPNAYRGYQEYGQKSQWMPKLYKKVTIFLNARNFEKGE